MPWLRLWPRFKQTTINSIRLRAVFVSGPAIGGAFLLDWYMPDVASLVMSVDSRPVDQAVRSLADLERQGQRTEAVVDGVSNSGQGLRKLASEADSAGRSMGLLAAAAKGAIAALSVDAIIDMADSWGQYASRMKMATRSIDEYQHAQERMSASAQKTFRSINETRESFIQLSPILREMGYSLDQSIDAVDTFSGLLVVNGANAERSAGAMNALAKSFQKGKVDAEAWMTIYSTADTIVEHIAASSGLAASEIRRLGAEGKLGADMLAQALTTGYIPVLKQVEAMPTTVRDAFTNLNTVFSDFVGRANDTSKATSVLVGGINALADNLDTVIFAAGALGTLKIGATLVAWGAGAVVAARPVAALAVHYAKLTVSASAAAAAGNAARIAFAAVGGPIGLLSIAATTGYIIWDSYAEKTKLAQKALAGLGSTADEVRENIDKLNASQRTMAKDQASKDMESAAAEMENALKRMLGPIRDLRDRDEASAVAWLREEFKSLAADSALSADEVNAQMQGIVDSLESSGRITKEHAAAFTELIAAYYRGQDAFESSKMRLDALNESQKKAAASSAELAEQQRQQAIAAAQAELGLEPKKWDEHIKRLEASAATIGMNAQQMAVYAAKAMGASDAQAELAGTLAGAEQAAKGLQKATADKDEKAIAGAKATLAELAAQEIQLRTNAVMASTYLQMLALGISATSAWGAAQEAGATERVKAEEEIAARLQAIYKNIAENTSLSASKTATATKTLVDAIGDQIKALQDQAATVGMTADQIALYKLAADGATSSQIALAQASITERKSRELALALAKKQTDVSAQAVRSLRDEVSRTKDLAATFGMSASAIEAMTAARLEDELVQARVDGATQEEIAGLEAMIALRHENANLLRSGEAREADLAQWNQWKQDIGQIFDQVGQSLTDALFEGGKSGRDLIKSIFKSLTLKVLIQPVMGALQGVVTQQLGGMLGYQQPGRQGSGISLDFNSLMGGSVGNSLSSFGSMIGSTMVSEFGAGLTAGAGGALSDAGATALMNIGTEGSSAFSAGSTAGGAGLGSAVGYIGAIYAATQGQYGTAVGTAIGTAILPGIGTAIGGLVGSLTDGLFSGDPKTRHGKSTTYEMTSELDLYRKHNEDEQSDAFYKSIEQMTQATIDGIKSTFDLLGVDAQLGNLWSRTDRSDTGKGDGVSSGGGILVNGEWKHIGIEHSSDDTQFGFGGWSDAPMLPRLAIDLQMTMLQAFQAAAEEMPRAINAALDGIDIRSLDETGVATLAATINDMIVGAQALSAAMELLPFENLKAQSLDTYMSIIQLTGGLQNLQQLQASYIDNYYTDAEKQALQIESLSRVFESIGLAMPAVTNNADQMKAAFRGIMDSLDLTTEAGQRAYATLLGIQDGFAGLANSVGAVMGAMGMSAVDVAKSAFSALQAAVQRERDSINAQALAQQKALQDAMKGVSASVSELTGLTGKLQSALSSMTRTIDTQASFSWAQGRIDRALSVAKLTGVMPQGADFDAALQAIQRPDAALYSTFEDFQAAQLKSANLVKDLNALAGDQLDSQKSQLQTLEDQLALSRDWQSAEMQRLDDLLNTSKAQLDSALGLEEGLLTLPEALLALAAAISALGGSNAYFAQNPDVKSAFDQGVFGDRTADQSALDHYLQYGADEGRAPPPGLSSGAEYLLSNPDVLGAWKSGVMGGISADEAARKHFEQYGKYEGRSFAVGTNYVPYDMTAQIHQGERIIPAADNRALMQALNSQVSAEHANVGLREEIRALRQTVQTLLTKIDKNTSEGAENTRRLADGEAEAATVRVAPDTPVPTVFVGQTIALETV